MISMSPALFSKSPEYTTAFLLTGVLIHSDSSATIAKNIKDQQGQYADELAALTDAIDAITKEVEDGNKS